MQKILLLFVLVISLSVALPVLADPVGVTLTNPLGPTTTFPALIGNISRFVVGLVASLATLMFVWAGILFVTSAGNPGKVETAKKAVLYAVIGMAVALAASGLIATVTAVVGS